jgi:tetratricopeptide (TPR) repeat protein
MGDYQEALPHCEDALEIFREIGDRSSEAGYVGNIGRISLRLGDYAAARSRFEDALAIARELGDSQSEGFWIGSLGEVAREVGDYQRARGRCEEALAIARAVGDRRSQRDWLGDLGGIECELGDHAEARARFQEALTIASEVGKPDDLLLEACADLLVALERYEDATELLGAADAVTTRSRRRRSVSEQSRHEACVAACRDHQSKQAFELAFESGSSSDWVSASARAFELLGPA